MSLNVLVIPEDCHKDQHMLDPIITRLVQEIVPRARVKVCTNPRLRGVGQALKWKEHIRDIVEQYRAFVHLFLVIVDRDGDGDRHAKLTHLEERASDLFERDGRALIGALAWQEIEVWVLAGLKDLPKKWTWSEVRADPNPKERYFEPHAETRGLETSVGGGRKVLATEAASNYTRLRQLSPEVAELEDLIHDYLIERSAQ